MKFETHIEYNPHRVAMAESALLSVWAGLGMWHDQLVLVGGHVPTYLCNHPKSEGILPRPVTLDVDLGIALGSDEGRYGSLRAELSGHGFKPHPDTPSRFEKVVSGFTIPIDFLVEHPPHTVGAVGVEDIVAGILPGIDRALETARSVKLSGSDLSGSKQSVTVRVCEVGPFLALKLRAFRWRQQPKDAFDILYTLKHYDKGTAAAIKGFGEEVSLNNPACTDALISLEADFAQDDSPGPVKAALFALGDTFGESAEKKERRLLIRQEMRQAARHLLKSANDARPHR